MDSEQTAALKQAAARRVIARRRPGRVHGESEFLPPETCEEWIDDRVARLPADGPHGLAIRILEAGRQGAAAAAAAVGEVVSLTWDEQFVVWACLTDEAERPEAAGELVAAICDEWRRLGLHESPKPREAARAGAR
jgi:hypothetical protein